MDEKAARSGRDRAAINGAGGIRTHGPLSESLDFKSSAFNRSATAPGWNRSVFRNPARVIKSPKALIIGPRCGIKADAPETLPDSAT